MKYKDLQPLYLHDFRVCVRLYHIVLSKVIGYKVYHQRVHYSEKSGHYRAKLS